MGWPTTIVPGIVAQIMREDSQARCNPQDTTTLAPGATPYNTITLPDGSEIHVWNYPDVSTGQAATAATWRNGAYSSELRAGAAGDPNQWVAAVASGPWGTWSSIAAAQADLATVMHDPTIGEVEVAGTANEPPKGENVTSWTEGNQSHVAGVDPRDNVPKHWWQDSTEPGTPWHVQALPES